MAYTEALQSKQNAEIEALRQRDLKKHNFDKSEDKKMRYNFFSRGSGFSQETVERYNDTLLNEHLEKTSKAREEKSCDTCINEDTCDIQRSYSCINNDFKDWEKG